MSGAEPSNAGEDDRKRSLPAVREQLERVLAGAEFVATDRLRSFSSFVVTETLAGRAARLKAYTIALEVRGRRATFDPQEDPIVRIQAGRLRRAAQGRGLHRRAVRRELTGGSQPAAADPSRLRRVALRS